MMMTNHSKSKFGLIVVSAPSGAGKSTLCARLLADLSARIALSISSTSRAPRGQEQHGKEYFFLDREEFHQKAQAGFFAEWAHVHENYYGTLKETLENFWSGKKHVLLDIDVQGADSLRKAYPDRCFTIFIAPPSLAELEKRLRGRQTETEAAIQKRMKNAEEEMKRHPEFNLVLVNDDFEQTYQELKISVMKVMDELEAGTWQKQ
jgi:guanylate kinase